MSRQDPPHEPDEPDVGRWPRAWRIFFLLAAGVASWVLAVVLAIFVWRRLGL